jgi:predicted DNA-binding protein
MEQQTPEGMKRISALIPTEYWDRLEEIAKAEHRTFSQELRRTIAERIGDYEAKTAA